jgi:hypothetical protein
MAERVAADLKVTNFRSGTSPIVIFIRRGTKEIRFASPIYKSLGYPTMARTRCWMIDWQALATELPFLAPHTEFRVLSIQRALQKHFETQGNTKRQVLAVLRRLAFTRGVSVSTDISDYSVQQMQQYARLNDMGPIFDAELDRIRGRVALQMEADGPRVVI